MNVSRPGEPKTDERNKATPSVNHHYAAYPPIHSSVRPTAMGGGRRAVMVGATCRFLSSPLLCFPTEIASRKREGTREVRTSRFSLDTPRQITLQCFRTLFPPFAPVPTSPSRFFEFRFHFAPRSQRALMLPVFSLVRATLTSPPRACALEDAFRRH